MSASHGSLAHWLAGLQIVKTQNKEFFQIIKVAGLRLMHQSIPPGISIFFVSKLASAHGWDIKELVKCSMVQ